MKINMILMLLFTLRMGVLFAQEPNNPSATWEMLKPEGLLPTGRHECAFVQYQEQFYLIGGRGVLEVGIYNPENNTWELKGKTPMELHHFQAVVLHDTIFIVGAMTGRYPKETPVENVWKYFPKEDRWKKGAVIPTEFQRGGAGSVVYNNKIYTACGIEYGHTSGTTNVFNAYDPTTNAWQALTKAPHVRDHFSAIVANDKLYCIGGRNTSVHYPDNFGAFFEATIAEIDVYDFATEKWHVLKNPLPIPTAAGGVVLHDNKIYYMGGEGKQKLAYKETQCLDLETEKWSHVANMAAGMHGSGAILHNGNIYWAAGSYKKGGSNLNTIQKLGISD